MWKINIEKIEWVNQANCTKRFECSARVEKHYIRIHPFTIYFTYNNRPSMQHSADRHELKITGLLDGKSRSQQNRNKRLTNKKKGGRGKIEHDTCVVCYVKSFLMV